MIVLAVLYVVTRHSIVVVLYCWFKMNASWPFIYHPAEGNNNAAMCSSAHDETLVCGFPPRVVIIRLRAVKKPS